MIFAFETSTPRASLALWDEGKIVWEADFTTQRAHNSRIFGPVEEALKVAGEKIELIVVGNGPGSYSGVRVGISVANGLSLARGIPVIGMSSLSAYPEGNCTVISDARRKTIAVAAVKNRQLTAEPDLIDADEFAASISGFPTPIYTADAHLAEEYESVTPGYPTASALAEAVSAFDAATIQSMAEKPLEPHYLRPPFITVAKKKPSFRK